MAQGFFPTVPTRKPIVVYGLSVAAMVFAVAAHQLLNTARPSLAPIALYGAIAFAVWLGGWRPAIVVVALGSLAAAYSLVGRLGEEKNLVDLSAVGCSK